MAQGKAENGKMQFITLMNVIACIAVVYLHANGCFWTFSTERYWATANVIECVFYFAVPCFFMITGATLLDFYKKYSLKEYFGKRIRKTLIPFLIWSALALLYRLFVTCTIAAENLSPLYIWNAVWGDKLTGVYWFFPVLFSVYLCIPLLSAVAEGRRTEVFRYLSICAFLVNLLVPFVSNVFGLSLQWPVSVTAASSYLLYVLVGYLASRHEFTRGEEAVIYILALAGLAAHIIGTYCTSMAAGEIIRTYKGYNNVPCILYSFGIFVFVKQRLAGIMNTKLGRLISRLSGYTFAVYLIHWFVLDAILNFTAVDNRSILFRLLSPVGIIAVSAGIAFVLKKIPIVKKIVP